MIPELEDFGVGYNELEKMEVIQKHYGYFQREKQRNQINTKEDQIKQLAQEYLQTEFTEQDEQNVKDMIKSLDEEKSSMERRLNLLQKSTEFDLVYQNVQLLERLKLLYEDKLDVQRKNAAQLQIINTLLNQVYSLNKEFTIQMDDLAKYNSQIPNEREIDLQKQITKLKSELEYYKQLNQQVEFVQELLNQAEQTKGIIVEQLKQMRKVMN